MKKYRLFIAWVFLIVILVGGLVFLGLNYKFIKEISIDNDNNIIKYMELDDKDIYLYGLKEIIIYNDNTLKEYIEKYGIDKFIDKLDYVRYDGETTIYKDNLINVVECKVINGSDIYIMADTINVDDSGVCEKNVE